jgi:hypothetical protein
MGSPVGCCQVSKKERYDGMAMTAAMAAANMQPIKTFVMRPDLLSTCTGARRTSCPAKRSAGADELVDTLVLPPASLASIPSPALDTRASQAACTRQSGSSGQSERSCLDSSFSLACRFLNCTSPYNDHGPGLLSFKRPQRETDACYHRVPGLFSLCGYTKSKQCMVERRAEKLHRL